MQAEKGFQAEFFCGRQTDIKYISPKTAESNSSNPKSAFFCPFARLFHE